MDIILSLHPQLRYSALSSLQINLLFILNFLLSDSILLCKLTQILRGHRPGLLPIRHFQQRLQLFHRYSFTRLTSQLLSKIFKVPIYNHPIFPVTHIQKIFIIYMPVKLTCFFESLEPFISYYSSQFIHHFLVAVPTMVIIQILPASLLLRLLSSEITVRSRFVFLLEILLLLALLMEFFLLPLVIFVIFSKIPLIFLLSFTHIQFIFFFIVIIVIRILLIFSTLLFFIHRRKLFLLLILTYHSIPEIYMFFTLLRFYKLIPIINLLILLSPQIIPQFHQHIHLFLNISFILSKMLLRGSIILNIQNHLKILYTQPWFSIHIPSLIHLLHFILIEPKI